VYEVPCTRTSSHCHARRIASGGVNHTHPIQFKRPEIDYTWYDDAVSLKNDAIYLGASPITGPFMKTDERCHILQSRIKHRSEKIDLARKSTKRLQYRKIVHPVEMKEMKNYNEEKMIRQLDNLMKKQECEKMIPLLKQGAPVDYETAYGMTPVIHCVISGNKTSMIKVIKMGADLDSTNKYGMNALMWACKINNLVLIHALLDEGAKPNYDGGSGMNAIYVAVRHNRYDALELMIETIRTKNDTGRKDVQRLLDSCPDKLKLTPLMMCALYHNRRIARLLIKLGSKIEQTNQDGLTVTDIAYTNFGSNYFFTWISNRRVMGGLIQLYSDDDEEEKDERIAKANLEKAMEENNLNKIVEILKVGFISPDHEQRDGKTPLITAAKFRDAKVIGELLQQGCDPSYCNRLGVTACMTASRFSEADDALKSLIILIEYDNECVNQKDLFGNSALSIASQTRGNEKVCRLILNLRKTGKNM